MLLKIEIQTISFQKKTYKLTFLELYKNYKIKVTFSIVYSINYLHIIPILSQCNINSNKLITTGDIALIVVSNRTSCLCADIKCYFVRVF